MAIKLKPIIKRTLKPNFTEMSNYVLELNSLQKQQKDINDRVTFLKDKVAEYVDSNVESDAYGHRFYTVTDSTGKPLIFQRQARKKVSLNEDEALRFLRKRGLTGAIVEAEVVAEEVTEFQVVEALKKAGYSAFLDSVEVVDEDVLEQLVQDGKITAEEFESLCTIETTYASLIVKEKKGEDKDATQA